MSNPESAEPGSRAASVAAGLRRKIAAGSLSPGARMPSVRALAKATDVSPFTAARVYDVLVAEGLVEARRGSGLFRGAKHGVVADVAARRSGVANRLHLVVAARIRPADGSRRCGMRLVASGLAVCRRSPDRSHPCRATAQCPRRALWQPARPALASPAPGQLHGAARDQLLGRPDCSGTGASQGPGVEHSHSDPARRLRAR